jgi:CBS domain-containing protein
MQTLEQLAVRVKVLTPEDSIGKAAEAVRCSTVGAVPVVQDGILLGLLDGSILAEALAEGPAERLKDLSVAHLRLERVVALPETVTAPDALAFLQANGLQHAPVVDLGGGLVGMISNGELASAVCGRVRPPLIGGMATPFGVYLTGGGVRGGVGDFALMSTGVYMAVINFAAFWLGDKLFSPGGWLSSLRGIGGLLQQPDVAYMGTLVLFGLFFRLSWITGYHAAEHQVVHTIEAGDELRPEIVRKKPRVHPRCGTNLVVAVGLMELFWAHREWKMGGAFLPMLLTFFFWRKVGAWVQQHVTTRPATLKQLQSGIRAGQEVMERYQERGLTSLSPLRRIWNMGLLQVLAGTTLTLGVWWLVSFLPLPAWMK